MIFNSYISHVLLLYNKINDLIINMTLYIFIVKVKTSRDNDIECK